MFSFFFSLIDRLLCDKESSSGSNEQYSDVLCGFIGLPETNEMQGVTSTTFEGEGTY